MTIQHVESTKPFSDDLLPDIVDRNHEYSMTIHQIFEVYHEKYVLEVAQVHPIPW